MTAITGFAEFADDLEDFGDGLDDVADDMDDVADEVAGETADRVVSDASEFAPVDEGELQTSIFVNPFHYPKVREIIVGAPYGRYVEYGTKMHFIPPSEKTTYNKPVAHPGATPRPYLRPALHLNRRTMHYVFEREMERSFRRNL